MPDDLVHLRPFREPDLEMFTIFATDPAFSEPFSWSGFRSPDAFRRRWEGDGFLSEDPHYLAVAGPDDSQLGWVMWRDFKLGTTGNIGVWEIGALIVPGHRSRGVGTAAQRMLVEHLFATTPAHRVCALTRADNVAEQRSLEKCGFVREGRLRDAGYQAGVWRDVLVYGLLRGTHPQPS